jgi:hypothetical protein
MCSPNQPCGNQALREGCPVTCFLLPREPDARRGPLTIQRGVAGLFAQMAHTHGLYTSICRLSTILRCQQIELLTWKSAREALRWYHHPFSGALMQIRPDAELLLRVAGEELPGSVLIEYDRATSAAREYEAKLQCYADYQRETQRALPPLLMITRDERTAARICACIARVAGELRVIVVLEEALEQQEWQALLR